MTLKQQLQASIALEEVWQRFAAGGEACEAVRAEMQASNEDLDRMLTEAAEVAAVARAIREATPPFPIDADDWPDLARAAIQALDNHRANHQAGGWEL